MHRAPAREAAVPDPIAVLLVSADPALRAAWARKLPEGVIEAVDPPDPVAVRTVLDAGARGYLFRRPGGERPPRAEWTQVRTASGTVIELSARELEVLQGVADGRSDGDIAAALQLSPLTVKSHLARIGRKLGTGDRAHAVLLALRAGVIT